MNQLESQHQQALFQWAGMMTRKYPEIAYMFHVPNGGKRDRITAARLKAEGVKAGVPDIVLPVPRGKYHGLWIELKIDGGKPSQDQKRWHDFLCDQGYCAAICYGWDEARRIIESYLSKSKLLLTEDETDGKFQSE